MLVLVMIAVGSSLQHNGEMDALALLEFKTLSAQKPSWISLSLLLSCSSPYLLSCTSVLVGTQHYPSTSTAFLAKPQRLQRRRFTRYRAMHICDELNQ